MTRATARQAVPSELQEEVVPSDAVSVVRRAGKRLGTMVPARDGVGLATDLYFPQDHDVAPTPVLLARTPYGKTREAPRIAPYLEAGYVVAVQDVRGRHESEGDWRPFFNEGTDGYDAIEWLAHQSWCDGNVGTFGASYGGWTQWAAARLAPPHLRAMSVSVTAGRWMQQEVWHNGAVFLAALNWHAFVSGRGAQCTWLADWSEALWQLPLRNLDHAVGRDLPAWREWLEHPCADDYWAPLIYTEADFAAVDLPVLHVSGWYDGNLGATVAFYEGMRRHSPARDRQRLVVGPWDHAGAGANVTPGSFGGRDLEGAIVDMAAQRVSWFDRWLQAAPERRSGPAEAQARLYVTGADRWAETEAWPPEATPTSLFLRGGGLLDVEPGAGEAPDSYSYDPADPVVLFDQWDGYGHWTNPDLPTSEPLLGADRLLGRPDVLVYTSTPLIEDTDVRGVARVVLHASTDGLDTDWFVWLHAVGVDGGSGEVARGHVRGRFRTTLAAETLLEPNVVYEFDIELAPAAHLFRAGDSVRLVVSSSNFPRYDRNLNTGEPIASATRMRVARNTVYHDERSPSVVILPVV